MLELFFLGSSLIDDDGSDGDGGGGGGDGGSNGDGGVDGGGDGDGGGGGGSSNVAAESPNEEAACEWNFLSKQNDRISC